MAKKTTPPVNDAVKTKLVAIGSIRPNPANPRKNDAAVEHVAASIRRFGWQQPIVVNEDGMIIAGHTRYQAARALDLKRVPVTVFEGTSLDAVAFGIADNRTAEFAEWDRGALATLLSELQKEDALEGTGFSAEELEALMHEVEKEGGFGFGGGAASNDPGPQEPSENPVSKLGDLWLLGSHRLLCGDSTSEDDVARLMNGETAHLLATDPPYLVDYDGDNHPADHHKKAGREKTATGNDVGNKHWDAYIDPTSSVEFFTGYLKAALAHCVKDVPIYQWHATRRQMLVEQAWNALDLLFHQTIIWVKSRGVLTRSHFLWKHEPCFYGWPRGNMPSKERRPPPSETTIWEIDQAGENDGIHPTQKPRDIFRRPIAWHTRKGEICLEPFSGSGTQLIAAEELERRCYAMELSPNFVDADLLRWQKTTGKEAILDGTKKTFAQVAAERGIDLAPSES